MAQTKYKLLLSLQSVVTDNKGRQLDGVDGEVLGINPIIMWEGESIEKAAEVMKHIHSVAGLHFPDMDEWAKLEK